MDENLKESFTRVYKKIEDIEEQQDGSGCRALQVEHQKVKELVRSTAEMKTEITTLRAVQRTTVPGATLRWFASAALAYAIIFGTYIVQAQNATSDAQHTHIAKCAIIKEHLQKDIEELQEGQNDKD